MLSENKLRTRTAPIMMNPLDPNIFTFSMIGALFAFTFRYR